MSDILDTFPEYGQTGLLDKLRETEYSFLDDQGHLYLDYTGAGIAAKSQHAAHNARLTENLFGNPHSLSPTSESSTKLVEDARAQVLSFLNASPDTYTVIFTQNATGAARLVGEAYPFTRHKSFVLTADNHNSVNGIREFARGRSARTVYVPLTSPELRVNPSGLARALAGHWWEWGIDKIGLAKGSRDRGLFAYPAQSNFSGVRHPLEWVTLAQKCGFDVLLDTAAYLPTNTLDLSDKNPQPDFLMVSWYKLFGYPTGVGCLVARRDTLARLERPWFSGGSVLTAGVGLPWHRLAADEVGFEDGTLNFLSIPDIQFGLQWLERIRMDLITTRVRCLTGWFIQRMVAMKHSDGTPMAQIYGPSSVHRRGGTVCFNFLDAKGKIVDERLVARESAAAYISLRTGCFCNPGGTENAFGVDAEMLRPYRRRLGKVRSIDTYIDMVGLPSGGAVRVSFGLVSNTSDVDRFFEFAIGHYRDRVTTRAGLPPRLGC
ncbi:PLP-dependent transferase [Aspergillus ellipticus CBS 707.79]|uniref:PLP-dependent transferase n=1 Tax=Aspergillus ellipticus CBS 707.79 TaxID=1448320 RepID=A0A319CVD0_9EURO|nr:PLP-dependent transferase [Aspergillus ellipticus CBS 707.79]